MSRATLTAFITAALLIAGALISEPPRVLQALTTLAMLGALAAAGGRLARFLCPGFDVLSRTVAAFTFAVALAVVPATWMGQWGMMRPAPFLLWTAAALLLSRMLPVPSRPAEDYGAALTAPADRLTRIEWAMLLAAGGAVALVGLKFLYYYRWVPVGLGPDDESYHLAAVGVWHRFGDLRMIKFAVGDTSTTFYPVGGEVWSWVLLAPLRDSDFLARFAQLPFALFSFVATASIGRRLGLPLRSALLGALLYAAIRRVFPVLALQAGNDHSASFFTLAAIDGVLALAARPRAGVAVYAGAALGLLLGTKYTALLFGPTVIGFLILIALGQRLRPAPPEGRLPVRTLAGLAAVFAVAAAVTGGYTYLRNWATAGNPVFPVPVSLFGHPIFPGWEQATVSLRSQDPEFQIDLWKFLLDRRDLLGNYFPYTLLPAALLAPFVALWRRRRQGWQWWRDALVLALPVVLFLEFLYLMHDHRDMRYFMPGVALAAMAFAWLVELAGAKASAIRAFLLLVLTFHVTRKLDFGGGAGAAVALVLIGLGWVAVRQGPRLAVALARPAPRRWLAVGAVAAVVVSALPLGAVVDHYQAVKLTHRLPALALDRMTGPGGAAVAYAGLNKPYTFFGSRLQSMVYIVPRNGELESQYYRWGGTLVFPFDSDDYVLWQRRLKRLRIGFVVVHRSPWEEPERGWMAGRPRAFRLEYFDLETEIWRVVPEAERARLGSRHGAAGLPGPGPAGEGAAPKPE